MLPLASKPLDVPTGSPFIGDHRYHMRSLRARAYKVTFPSNHWGSANINAVGSF